MSDRVEASAPQKYQSYRGLPVLAGVCSFERAVQPGMSVEGCVGRLKRFHYAFTRLHEILTARLTAEPIYELKTAFSHHSYLCAEHVQSLRTRIGEMREPPLGLEEIPHPALEIFFDEILNAPTTESLLLGVYEHALPALHKSLSRYLDDTNPLADAPSVRVCRFACLEVRDMIEFGVRALASLVDNTHREEFQSWTALLLKCLDEAGRLGGSLPARENVEATLPRQFSAESYQYDPLPRRDERFQDVWNQGVNAESFLYKPEMPARAKALMMLYKRLREIDVPEMMASIIHETKGKPWEYYRDMSRQLWDEARHAMLGEVGFVALGIDWTRARITHNWSTRLNTECTPIERHAVLYFIEQGLMTRTGKRYEWEVGTESGFPIMATIQDFDWADEVLHAQLGREWYIPEMGDWKKALEYGDQCWSKILSNWHTVRDQGLTKHDNWWPDLYRTACTLWGDEPDGNALAFAESYEGQRADLKSVATSG